MLALHLLCRFKSFKSVLLFLFKLMYFKNINKNKSINITILEPRYNDKSDQQKHFVSQGYRYRRTLDIMNQWNKND